MPAPEAAETTATTTPAMPPVEKPTPCSTCGGRSLRYKVNGYDVTISCPECGNRTDPAPTPDVEARPQPCPTCVGYGWVSMPDGQDILCPRCRPAEEPPAKLERSTMPAFPMRKEVTPDRVTLVREPCEKGTAFEQFEATLRWYLEQHPVYRDRERVVERVVERDRPCPICAAETEKDEDLDEDEWGEDEGGEEDDDEKNGEATTVECSGCDGRGWIGPTVGNAIRSKYAKDCPRCEGRGMVPKRIYPQPVLAPAPPSFPATLRQALAEETAAPRDVREIAAALVRQMKNGNVDAIRFVAEGGER